MSSDVQVDVDSPDGTASSPVPVAPAVQQSPAAESKPSPEFLEHITHEFARRHLLLSGGAHDGEEILLVAERTKPAAAFNVGVALGRPVRTRAMPAEDLAAAIDRAYAGGAARGVPSTSADSPIVVVEGSKDVEHDLATAVRDAEQDLLNTQGKAPTVRLVDLLLFEALQRGASDMHIQPVHDRTLVRYRLDGALHTVRELPASLAAGVVTRIKVMARLDVAEQRAPQDGRATVTVGDSLGSRAGGSATSGGTVTAGHRVDLRISTLPSTFGERVVARFLDPSRSPHLLSFAALGMPPKVERAYLAQVSRASGIVLSTGPTGSGKTTTLYATLAWLSASYTTSGAGGLSKGCELNIMTVEDPVEYGLSAPGLTVSQTQVDPKKNVTFATGLRHILRQDPDVIMVGEIRDQETARMAVQASLTGHLVLSTLHTNDAASAVARLLDLGVEPFLVCSSVSAVLAQRLVRQLHSHCSGAGCPQCFGTGFKGRMGVFELLVLDPPLRDLVARRASSVEIKDAAQKRGMVALSSAGASLVARGVTTHAEVARVIDAAEEVLA